MWEPASGLGCLFNVLGFLSMLGVIAMSTLIYVFSKRKKRVLEFEQLVEDMDGEISAQIIKDDLLLDKVGSDVPFSDIVWMALNPDFGVGRKPRTVE